MTDTSIQTPSAPERASTPERTTAPERATADGEETITDLGASLRQVTGGRWASTRAYAREVLTGPEFIRPPGQSLDQARDWTNSRLQRLVELGFGRDGFPETVGGNGDIGRTSVAFEQIAHLDPSLTVKVGVQMGLFGGAILNLGTEHHHRTYLPGVMSVATPGCFGMTEVGHGSDVQSLETTITYDEATEEFVIDSPTPSATKTYIGGAGRDARLAVVFGQLRSQGEDHGIHAIVVPVRDAGGADLPGVRTGDNGFKGGLIGVDNGTLTFDAVRVPRANLLNRYGDVAADGSYTSPIDSKNRRFFTMLGTLVRGRVSVAAGAGAMARTALSIATRYALRRRQFDAPGRADEVTLMDYLVHQRKLLPAIAQAYALQFAQDRLISRMHDLHTTSESERNEVDQRELETRAAAIKAATSRFANDTIQMCREACGGAGYLAENRIVGLRADADVFATFEGDNTVLQQLVAKGVLTDYRATWGDMDVREMVQFAMRAVGARVIERTAARPVIERLLDTARRRDPEDLLDRGWHVEMFTDRETHVVESLAGRMRTAMKATGDDAFTTFNTTQDHVMLASRVHTDRVILEAFIDAIDSVDDPATADLLNRVCDLYVLSNLEADKGWFLEHHRLSDVRSKAITRQVNELCETLSRDALALVEGFGIPTDWLGARLLSDLPGSPVPGKQG